MHAFKKLLQQIKIKNSRLILVPRLSEKQISPIQLKKLIDELAPHIVGIKLNPDYYNKDNCNTLCDIMSYTAQTHPDLLRILDTNHNDTDNVQEKQAKENIANFHPDIITVTSYMGESETIIPYLKANPNIGVFAATKCNRIQNMYSEGMQIFQHTVLEIRKADTDRVGITIDSTNPEYLQKIRAAELENGYTTDTTVFIMMPESWYQDSELSFIACAGSNAIYPISIELPDNKYPNGLTALKFADMLKNTINNEAKDGYQMKSITQYFIEDLIKHDILKIAPDANKAKWFKLKNGTLSPLYWDARMLQSYPYLRETASYLMSKKIRETIGTDNVESITAVPYGALSMGFDISRDLKKPVITPRKEGAKNHGDTRSIVGKAFGTTLVVEDTTTGGESILEVAQLLESHNVTATDAIVLIDRQQGAFANLSNGKMPEKKIQHMTDGTTKPDNKPVPPIKLHNVFTQKKAIQNLSANHPMQNIVLDYIRQTIG
ncbi:MAG: orotidine 5'-phosphate decarboxylase [Alphaproteobacteria bacterium]|nr:orotidine 5'-phosphate decarboxylase [Alphaproteobacteria bacterium]